MNAMTLSDARLEIRRADKMIALLAEWDALPYAEKIREVENYEDGVRSRFAEVPGFGFRWCAECHSEVILDYTDDPEGTCMICGAWAADNGPDAWVA